MWFRYLLLFVIVVQVGVIYRLEKDVERLTQQVAESQQQLHNMHVRMDHDAMRRALLETKFKLFMADWLKELQNRHPYLRQGLKE